MDSRERAALDPQTQIIRDEWARKDAHYAANPIEPPRARDGTLLTLGQRVRFECADGPEGVITELTIRCYGLSGTDPVYDYSKGIGFDERALIGEEPQQRVWIFINGRSCIHRPEQIVSVIDG